MTPDIKFERTANYTKWSCTGQFSKDSKGTVTGIGNNPREAYLDYLTYAKYIDQMTRNIDESSYSAAC